ncbi:MAG: ribose 5-phosphate isomerase B [Pseudomonadota bacterium]
MTDKILIGSDHGGFALKTTLLAMDGIAWDDCGVTSDAASDYPDIAHRLCHQITKGAAKCGVLICGTGVGISIAANRISGIRAALCADVTTARLARQHNDANVLVLGGRLIGSEVATDIVKTFLATPFSGEDRHIRRIQKIEETAI